MVISCVSPAMQLGEVLASFWHKVLYRSIDRASKAELNTGENQGLCFTSDVKGRALFSCVFAECAQNRTGI